MDEMTIEAGPPRREMTEPPPPQAVEGAARIRDDFSSMLTDESRMPGGTADRILFVRSELQISEALQDCYEKRMPVTVSAGRTGIVGGAVPFGGAVLSLEHFNRFRGARWDDGEEAWCVRVDPGMTLEGLSDALSGRPVPEGGSAFADAPGTRAREFFKETGAWFYPPDPTERTARIGGTVATNASGSRSLLYGPTRRHVTALRVVLADGSVLQIRRGRWITDGDVPFQIRRNGRIVDIPVPDYGRPTVKSAAGYWSGRPLDLLDLFIGSEGTLGVISEVELRLTRKPEAVFGGVAFFPSEREALQFVRAARADRTIRPSVLEFFDAASLRTIYGNAGNPVGEGSPWPVAPGFSSAAVYFEQALKKNAMDACLMNYDRLLSGSGSSMDNTWGAADEGELKKMAEFRHALPEIVNSTIASRKRNHPGIHKISTDFAVPDSGIEEMMKWYRSSLDATGLEYLIFGHIGENHVHVNIIPASEEEFHSAKAEVRFLAQKAVSLGGTVSAEHGIGKIKKEYLRLMFSQKDLEEMKSLKKALDPFCLLGRETLMDGF
jgi:D-lactate dehydrogenase (cytochrome)